MQNNFQSNALKEQLKALQKKERTELKKISHENFLKRLRLMTKIKIKYYRLRQELWENNYSNSFVNEFNP